MHRGAQPPAPMGLINPPMHSSPGRPDARSQSAQSVASRSHSHSTSISPSTDIRPYMGLNKVALRMSHHADVKKYQHYDQHFVDTGEFPQNFISDAAPDVRFSEYPQWDRLIKLKDEVLRARAHPAQHLKTDLRTFDLTSLGVKFDVILIDPPWGEYQQRVIDAGNTEQAYGNAELAPWSVDQISQLKIDAIADRHSFCLIWAGETHLEDTRALLTSWGFRRCEDICWCKTNIKQSGRQRHSTQQQAKKVKTMKHSLDESSYFVRSKEHCLMGIRGMIQRSYTRMIHANIDTDVILAEQPDTVTSTEKPTEIYDIIERFCLGRRRLELFGTDHNIRDGWVTIGKSIAVDNFQKDKYHSWVSVVPTSATGEIGGDEATTAEYCWPNVQDHRGGHYVGTTDEIEHLRPKSPVRGATSPT
eukprot:GHVN01042241.1.p1 GENE.GHVN01042241.1~~GHVN01042241.1.p1  ORF type:complete len:489 (-),score=100.04 GHVN01042241.1:141-1391(-)